MTQKQSSHLPALSLIAFIFAGCVLGPSDVFAQASSANSSRPASPIRTVFYTHVYILSQKEIAEASRKNYVWDLERASKIASPFQSADTQPPPQKVFKSLKSADLRSWVGSLPTGSMIQYWSNPESKQKMSATLQAALDDFARYCQSKDVGYRVVSTVM